METWKLLNFLEFWSFLMKYFIRNTWTITASIDMIDRGRNDGPHAKWVTSRGREMMALVQSELHQEGEKWWPLCKVSYIKRWRNEGPCEKWVTSRGGDMRALVQSELHQKGEKWRPSCKVRYILTSRTIFIIWELWIFFFKLWNLRLFNKMFL